MPQTPFYLRLERPEGPPLKLYLDPADPDAAAEAILEAAMADEPEEVHS